MTSKPRRLIFEPTNQLIIGLTNITADGTTKYEIFDDIMQLTFSSPVDTKPVLALGSNEQLGYTYGARLYAGTMQLPANSYPSIFRLFSDWVQLLTRLLEQHTNTKITAPSVNQEDLPPFDMVVVSIPEQRSELTEDTMLFQYVFKYVKFVETTVELSVRSPDAQIAFYRFTANYIGQKLVKPVIDKSGKIAIDAAQLISALRLSDLDPLLKLTLSDREIVAVTQSDIIRKRIAK